MGAAARDDQPVCHMHGKGLRAVGDWEKKSGAKYPFLKCNEGLQTFPLNKLSAIIVTFYAKF
jgi:hypothetical protein